MKKPTALISLFVILLLYGCVSSTFGITPSPSSTGSTSTAKPTLLPFEPSATPVPALSLEKTVIYQCLDVVGSPPSDAKPQGILAIFEQHPYLLNLETGVKKPLDDGQGKFSVSLDGKWLASQYVDESNKIWLRVETLGDTEQKQIPWNDDWFLLGGWLDNEHVWISHKTEPLVTVINPFSGEQQELAPDFPGLETVAAAGEHFALGASTVLYNSSLTLAVYPRLENDGYVYLVLWDVQSNRVLAKVMDRAKSFSYLPLWSLDQKEIYVAMVDKWDNSNPRNFIYDFFSFNQDGQVRQLTDFGASFADTRIGDVSLSPDGRKIAFWLQLRPSLQEEQQLAVLDLETQQVTDYCVPGSLHLDAPSPIWSLDSRYLAVQNQYEPNAGRVILVDTQQKWAVQLTEIVPNGWPAGWMAEP
ncbi:MAG: hypothetical protein JW730_07100 [Anaerolineales bacterium]|nr:hypothetical protein [Anaerolineales bacterium]